MDAQQVRSIAFGDFELDVRAGELRKNGLRIRLQDQSFQILRMLLERPGEVVLREEIRKKLWPNDTIVEFDHSINAAVKRLRNALGESAEEPRVIETLAKRGYRFAGALRQGKAESTPVAVVARRQWIGWSLAAAATVGLATVSFLHFREKPAAAAPVHFQIPAPENTTIGPQVSLSPDGRKLAFKVGSGRLWVHFLDSGESRELSGCSGVPFWSWDSRFIGYPFQRKLMKIEATGGVPQIVADLPGAWGGGAWNQDDVIVFGARELYRVPVSGGVPVAITALDPARQESMHFGPSLLPDRRRFVYVRRSSDTSRSAIYVGSVDANPQLQSSRQVVSSNWQPSYASSPDPGMGYLLFVRDGALMAQPFDNRRMELTGQPSVLTQRVSDNNPNSNRGGWGGFSASGKDVLVFQPGATADGQLTWYDRAGKVLGTIDEPGVYLGAALSPDGTRLAMRKEKGPDRNIWLLDTSRDMYTRFTFGSAADADPVWSSDGSRIIFRSNRNGFYDLYQKPANGGGQEELLFKSSEDKYPYSWSSDGRFLLYAVDHPKTRRDIWVLPLEGDRKPVPFLNTEFSEQHPQFSPDGHWVAYASDESDASGRYEVYVRSFSMNSSGTVAEGGAKLQISNGIAVEPRWRADGRELYYWTSAGIMAVDIATSPEFKPGKARLLGIPPFAGPWGPSADGQRFFALAPKITKPEPFTVVLNWQAGLKK